MYLIQNITSYNDLSIQIYNLEVTKDFNEAKKYFDEHVNEFKKELLEKYSKEDLLNFIEDYKDYWEFLDEEGNNVIFVITEIKL